MNLQCTDIPRIMRAAVTVRHGDLDALEYQSDYPTPSLRAGEVLVKIAACALNFHDIFTRRGMPGIKLTLPVIVGSDISGTIAALGDSAQGLRLGDRVLVDPAFSQDGKPVMYGETMDGGRAEYVAVRADHLVPVPDNVSLEAAAALPLAYGTAYRMLVTKGRLQSGERLLVLGASGGVGAACVQIGKSIGAEVVACASTDEKLARLVAIGADHTINYSVEPFSQGVRRIFGKPRASGGGGVDVAVNFTGGDTMLETQKSVCKGGRILSCGATAGYQLVVDARYWWTFEHEMIGSDGWLRQDLVVLMDWIANGRLRPLIDRIFPLHQAREAEAMLEQRLVVGKVLLSPEGTP